MIRTVSIYIILMILSWQAGAQRPARKPAELMERLSGSRPDTGRVEILLELGRYYVEKPGSEKDDLDSAFVVIDEALRLSRQLQAVKWINRALEWKGDAYLEEGGLEEGKNCFNQVKAYYQERKNLKAVARLWDREGECVPDNFIQEKIRCYENSYALYKQLKMDSVASLEQRKAATYRDMDAERSSEWLVAKLPAMIQQNRPDTVKVRLLLQLARYYIEKQGNNKDDLDSAFTRLDQAMELCRQLHTEHWTNETLKWMGDCYLEGNKLEEGKACFYKVIDYYHGKGDRRAEAETWIRLSMCISADFPDERIICSEKALVLYESLNDTRMATEMRDAIDNCHMSASVRTASGRMPANEDQLRIHLMHSKTDTARIEQLVNLGRFYIEKPGNEKRDLDSAMASLNLALELSKAIRSNRWINEILKWKGDCYLEGMDLAKGKACFMQVIEYYHRLGDKRQEEATWSRLGDCLGWSTPAFNIEKIHSHRRSAELLKQLRDTIQLIHFYALVSNEYLCIPDIKNHLDSSLVFSNRAIYLRKLTPSGEEINGLRKLAGLAYIRKRQLKEGVQLFGEIENYYRLAGDKAQEAAVLVELGDNCTVADSAFLSEEIRAYGRAERIYNGLTDTVQVCKTLLKLSMGYLQLGKLELAEKAVVRAEAVNGGRPGEVLNKINETFGKIYKMDGDLHKELYYNTKLLKGLREGEVSWAAMSAYFESANTYDRAGFFEKALALYRTGLSVSKNNGYWDAYFYFTPRIAEDLVHEDSVGVALALIQKIIRDNPPVGAHQECWVDEAMGRCYEAMHDYPKAERYYLDMDKCVDTLITGFNTVLETFIKEYAAISNFYVTAHQPARAAFFLDKIKYNAYERPSFSTLIDVSRLRFRVDSAKGDYVAAISDFHAYKVLSDSFYKSDHIRQIVEYRILADVEQKEKDLESQSKNIRLWSGKKLENDKMVNEGRMVRNMVGGGCCLLVLLLGTGYGRYLLKQKKSEEMELQQQALLAKNEELEGLLDENDWLLREVHHRVKNNLQIVTGLLNSQASYMQDERAQAVMAASLQRVQAMAMIHQKLYKATCVGAVAMCEYVNELLDYLSDTLCIKQKICFIRQVGPLELDISYAVPIGLIVNELVTNAVEYAFPFGDQDTLIVGLFKGREDELHLEVLDNGKGVKGDLDILESRSFGMTLVKELVGELNGRIMVDRHKGTKVRIIFPGRRIGSELRNI